MPEVETYVHPLTYSVSVWPDGIECTDSSTWSIEVDYRGAGKWAVCQRSRICLSRSGEWEWEMRPSEREDEWLAEHRFTLDEALALAREHAPKVTVNGMTAVEVLEKHRLRHGNGSCRP